MNRLPRRTHPLQPLQRLCRQHKLTPDPHAIWTLFTVCNALVQTCESHHVALRHRRPASCELGQTIDHTAASTMTDRQSQCTRKTAHCCSAGVSNGKQGLVRSIKCVRKYAEKKILMRERQLSSTPAVLTNHSWADYTLMYIHIYKVLTLHYMWRNKALVTTHTHSPLLFFFLSAGGILYCSIYRLVDRLCGLLMQHVCSLIAIKRFTPENMHFAKAAFLKSYALFALKSFEAIFILIFKFYWRNLKGWGEVRNLTTFSTKAEYIWGGCKVNICLQLMSWI